MPDDILLPLPPRGPYRRGPQRDGQAVRLKALGWSLEEIAVHLGLDGKPERAAAAIRRGLANTVRVARDEQRLLELNSLDELERACWMQLQAHHVLVSNGRVIRDDDGEPLNDDRFALETIDRILKVKEQRNKLLGLNAPARHEVLTVDSVDSAIAELERELAERRRHESAG
jgi:hypothetical protein